MRILSSIIAVAAGVAFCGAAMATSIEFHFARANTSQTEFRLDRQFCSNKALTRYVSDHVAGNGGSALRYQVVETQPATYVEPKLFFDCMVGRGYQPAPNGFSSGKMWVPA